jgi:hypothetical protein
LLKVNEFGGKSPETLNILHVTALSGTRQTGIVKEKMRASEHLG